MGRVGGKGVGRSRKGTGEGRDTGEIVRIALGRVPSGDHKHTHYGRVPFGDHEHTHTTFLCTNLVSNIVQAGKKLY